MIEPVIYFDDALARLPQLPAQSFDAIIADIPSARTTLDWDQVVPFEPMWRELHRVAKRNAAIVLLGCTQPFTSDLIESNRLEFRYCWYWYKNMTSGFQNANTQPLRAMEEICVFYREQPTYNRQLMRSRISDRTFQDGAPNGDSSRSRNPHNFGVKPVQGFFSENVTPWNVLEIPCVPRATGTLHSSEKPVELMEVFVRTYSNPGEHVLDFTAGSFTTGIACLNTNRGFTGIEKGREEFETGRTRMLDRISQIELMLIKPWELIPDVQTAEEPSRLFEGG